MFQTFRNAWKIPELKNRLLFTLAILVVYRLGCAIPVPFVSGSALTQMFANGDMLSYLNMMSGGALARCTLFALGVTPYINASIIVQLLTVAIPALENLAKEADGQQKLQQINRYAGGVIALIMSIGYYFVIRNMGALKYVSGAVGKDGFLTVIKDLGLKEPYVGQVQIVSGEIAEDITNYFATSEQIPTVCALGVLVNPDLTIRKAGGFIIQLLPTADDTIIDKVEKCISDIDPVTTMLDKGLSPETICRTVLPAFKLDVLDTSEPEYRCNCSRERVSRALISMGRDELEKLKEDEKTEVCCQFCDKKYVFTPADIDRLLEESKGKEDK